MTDDITADTDEVLTVEEMAARMDKIRHMLCYTNAVATTSCEPFTDDEIEQTQRVKPNRAERRRKQKIRQRTEWD